MSGLFDVLVEHKVIDIPRNVSLQSAFDVRMALVHDVDLERRK